MDKTSKMVALLEARRQTLQTLLDMTLRQVKLIQQDAVSELMTQLSEKDPHLRRFAQLQEALRPLVEVPSDERDWQDAQQRARCQQIIEESDAMLEQMMTLEQQCEQALMSSRDRLAEQLQQQTGSQRAARAYARGNRATSTGSLDVTSGPRS